MEIKRNPINNHWQLTDHKTGIVVTAPNLCALHAAFHEALRQYQINLCVGTTNAG